MKQLWYKKSAKKWDEALPVGNGHIGAMLFSGEGLDQIGLSCDTIWAGSPYGKVETRDLKMYDEVRRLVQEKEYNEAQEKLRECMPGYCPHGYVTLGNMFVELLGARNISLKGFDDTDANRIEYKRCLDLENAIHTCSYNNDGIVVNKEAFASYPNRVFVYKITTSVPTSLVVYTACALKHDVTTTTDEIIVSGRCPTKAFVDGNVVEYDENIESIEFTQGIRIKTDGLSYFSGSNLYINNATELIVYVAVETSYNGFDKLPVSEGKEHKNACLKVLDDAMSITYEELKKLHIEDYRSLFDRVSLSIDEDNGLPTDERLNNPEDDSNLAELLFDYGRYLMIASSRKDSQPANLQGIWNDVPLAPWHSNYTININLQMNYWLNNACGLEECEEPLFKKLKECMKIGHTLSEKGWNMWHTFDIWCFPYEVLKLPKCGFWPYGGVWLSRHIWERYLYTGDKEFLKENMDVLVGACQFLKEWMVENKDGKLVSYLSISPENYYVHEGVKNCLGESSTMEITMTKEIFDYTGKALEIIGEDGSEYKALANKIKDLEIGNDGRLLEWDRDIIEEDKGHRHVSHLYGVYPGELIKEGTELFEAARKSLDTRMENNGAQTGWSNAWCVCLYARFGDGEKANERIINMYKRSIYKNMFDAHPPFQIDGNFGVCAGIVEMLMQSHQGNIKIAPAVPKQWKKVSVRGFRAKGGYVVDFDMENGNVIRKKIVDRDGNVVM